MPLLTFHLIPHTHWDREWYLLRAELQVRLVDMMDDLVKRLREEPGYRSFLLDGQTVLVDDYVRARPEREAEVRELVRSGHLSVGPWYVLPDEQIPAGESLVRNLLFGTADANRLGGRLGGLYSPDAFGHPACWPDLAHGFGLRYGVVWRGLAPLERDWFKWTTESDSEVLGWHLPPAGYEIGAALPGDAQTLPEAWRWVRGLLAERAARSHIPVFVGADHHAAHPELPRLRGLLADLERPNTVRVSRLDEFFAAAAAEAARAPQLRGEQRSSNGTIWALQGVHGTRAPLKRRNGTCELWLERWAEPLVGLARWCGRGDRRPAL